MAAVMEPGLAVVVGIGTWRATVHYTDCLWYLRASHRDTPIPRRMKVVLCAFCRPSTEDLVDHTPAVDWYEFSPAALPGVKAPRMVDMDPEQADDIHGRRQLGIGKTKKHRSGWSER